MFKTRPYAMCVASFVFLSSVSSCGGSERHIVRQQARSAAAIAIVSGNNQAGLEGKELPQPLVVRVLDATGSPVSGQAIQFRVLIGEGSVLAGEGISDENGAANERWTLGRLAGQQRLEALAVDPTSGVSVASATFDAAALAGPPAAIAIISGNTQRGIAGEELLQPLVVRVIDSAGSPVPGQALSFNVLAGEGSVLGGTVLSDQFGTARERWTLGRLAGPQALEVQAVAPPSGAPIALARFDAAALAGPPAAIVATGGSGQSAYRGTTLPIPIGVHVVDANGNSVSGVTVDFVPTAGIGSATPASTITDTSGDAKAAWTLGPPKGQQTMEARGTSLPAVTFVATAEPFPSSISLWTDSACTVTHAERGGTCSVGAYPARTVDGALSFDTGGLPDRPLVEVTDDCGGAGTVGSRTIAGGLVTYAFAWTPPNVNRVTCTVTARFPQDQFADELSVMASVYAPISDSFDIPKARITEFKDGKQAAVSYTWDDGAPSDFAIADIFERFGLRTSFYLVPGFLSTWGPWKDLRARGHEIGNHSMNHLHLSDPMLTDLDLDREITGAQLVLEEKIGVKPRVFVFPFGSVSERAAAVALRTHAATREPGWPFAGSWYQRLLLLSKTRSDDMNAALLGVLQSGGWLVMMGHGVDSSGWEPITSQTLEEHLSFATALAGEFWLDTFEGVALYRVARDRARPDVAVISPEALKVRLEGDLDPTVYTGPLTVELPLLAKPNGVRAYTEDGEDVPVSLSETTARVNLRFGQAFTIELVPPGS